MKRYYIPKTLTLAEASAPLLVVAGSWTKLFDSAAKARRAVPPVNPRRSPCRGWSRAVTDQLEPRNLNVTHIELRPEYLSQVLTRVRRDTPYYSSGRINIEPLIRGYMIIPAPDYARLKTNHKIGAPKGRLP